MSVDEDDAVAVDDNSGAAAAVEEVVAVADDEVDEAGRSVTGVRLQRSGDTSRTRSSVNLTTTHKRSIPEEIHYRDQRKAWADGKECQWWLDNVFWKEVQLQWADTEFAGSGGAGDGQLSRPQTQFSGSKATFPEISTSQQYQQNSATGSRNHQVFQVTLQGMVVSTAHRLRGQLG